jgi:diguanylate cyclase (GGDEF)-like protein
MSMPVILCVDDERIILSSLKSQLQNHLAGNYQIELAESGEEALEIIEELCESNTELPLVVTDHIMGGMYGDELLVHIKNKLPKTLGIMLTGQASTSAVGEAVNRAGLFRYISKPWDGEDFILTVKTALDTYNQQKQLVLHEAYQQTLNKVLQLVLKPKPFKEQISDVLNIALQAPCFADLKKGSVFVEPFDQESIEQPELKMIAQENDGHDSENPSFQQHLKNFKELEPQVQLIGIAKSVRYYQAPIILAPNVLTDAEALESDSSKNIVGLLCLYVDSSHVQSSQTEAFISSLCHTIAGMIRLSQHHLAIEQHGIQLEGIVEQRTAELTRALKTQARNNNILRKTNKELEYYATTDELTGLLNRRCLFERADQEAYRSKRYGRSMVLAMLDIDFFKAVNDQYGHQAGDRVLTQIAKIMTRKMREHDIIGRIGGEEFAIVMPDTELLGGKELCERIRQAIYEEKITIGSDTVSVSMSIGITSLGTHETSICAAMSRADQALFDSKHKGRNLITLNCDITNL